jgi:hypothetical protein
MLLFLLFVVGVVPACGSGPAVDPPTGAEPVFQVINGLTQWWSPDVGSVLDVGVPALNNTTPNAVRLLAVSVVGLPRGVQVLSTEAYSYTLVRHGIAGDIGDLPKMNPAEYVPLPVSSVVTEPHSYAPDFVVIALSIHHPGRFALNVLRIDYVVDGHSGWQYQNLDLTITISPQAATRTSTT